MVFKFLFSTTTSILNIYYKNNFKFFIIDLLRLSWQIKKTLFKKVPTKIFNI